VHRKKDRAQEIVTDLWPRCLCASLRIRRLAPSSEKKLRGPLSARPTPGSLKGTRLG